nr:YidC/Oxa1 family membrane protein insertase [bacterium]
MNAIVAAILDWAYSFTYNYGLAMLVFAFLLRLVLAPLDVKGRLNTRRMAEIQPKLEAINKKYANDPQMRARRTQELYKKEHYSPLGGCLPALIPLPLLLIIFSAMRAYSLEAFTHPLVAAMEQGNMDAITAVFDKSHFLWVQNIFAADTLFGAFNQPFPSAASLARLTVGVPGVFVDLSKAVAPAIADMAGVLANPGLIGGQLGMHASSFATGYDAVRETYLTTVAAGSALAVKTNGLFILPLLAGGLQFLQSWLSRKNQPATADGQQEGMMKGMMYFFPLFSVYICASYTSMFTVYWIASSLFAILMQYILDLYFKRKGTTSAPKKAKARA